MTLLFIDGFDGYSNSADLQTVYQYSNTAISFPVGRFGKQKSVQYTSTTVAQYILSLNLPTLIATGTFGFAVTFSTPQRTAALAVYFQDVASSSPQMSVEFVPMTGQIIVKRSTGAIGNSVILFQSALKLIAVGPWYYIEIQPVIASGTSGSVIVRINGAAVVTLTGVNTLFTANVGFNNIAFASSALTGAVSGTSLNLLRIDDLYVADTAGAAPWNSFLGDIRVQTLFPAAAGTFTQLTPLSSQNYTQVRETSADADTSYVIGTTAGLHDSFPATALLATTANVLGAQVKTMMRQDFTTPRTYQNRLLSGTVGGAGDVGGAVATASSGYDYVIDMYQYNPATSAQWTVAGINAAQYGYQIVS